MSRESGVKMDVKPLMYQKVSEFTRFSLYTAYHILFKMQEPGREKRAAGDREKRKKTNRRIFKNHIEREKNKKKRRKMTDLHKKRVYK